MGKSEHVAPDIEGYEFIRPIGRGGFSDVYLYQQQMPRREVAIKVLRTEALTESLRRQFSAEANLMARLSNHTNIASIYAADIDDAGEPYLVMEYCSGGSLGDSYRHYPMSVRDTLKLGIRICGALEAAHRAGIVHRDIKPANILLTEYGVPVLSDFGISTIDEEFPEATMARAQVYTTGVSDTGSVGLSLPWAAPETLGDPPVSDTRSDRYSLAATLYSLLEGRSPHEIPGGPNGASHLTGRIQTGFIGAMQRPDVPPSLVALLRKAMAYDRAARFPSSIALGKSLQQVQRELGHDVTGLDAPRGYTPAPKPPTQERPKPAASEPVVSLPTGHPTVLPPPGAGAPDVGATHDGAAPVPRRRDLRPRSPWSESDSTPAPPPPTSTSLPRATSTSPPVAPPGTPVEQPPPVATQRPAPPIAGTPAQRPPGPGPQPAPASQPQPQPQPQPQRSLQILLVIIIACIVLALITVALLWSDQSAASGAVGPGLPPTWVVPLSQAPVPQPG